MTPTMLLWTLLAVFTVGGLGFFAFVTRRFNSAHDAPDNRESGQRGVG